MTLTHFTGGRRYTWEYEKHGRRWHGDYGLATSRFPDGTFFSLRHAWGWTSFTERGIRRKLARLIREERRRQDVIDKTRRESQ